MAKTMRILLVDDDEALLEGLADFLRAEGSFTVVGQSTDGAGAVRLAGQHKPDLAILDLTMPLMNGIEATRRLRARLPETRILVLSAQTSPGYVGSTLKAGADGYVTKDALDRELMTAIRAVMAGHGYVSEALRISC